MAGVFKLPRDSAITGFWVNLLGQVLLLFVVVPFLFGFHDRSRPFSVYLSEIRLTKMKPVLKLILLGISCYLFLALSMFLGTLVFRLSQGYAFNMDFFRTAFPLTSELPPNSSGWLFSIPPSLLEEVTFRGIFLALFLRFYNKPKAIFFSALCFGAMHLLNLLNDGPELVWVAAQVVWALILGLFYGYITLKTDSLLPAMLIHYLGNISIYPLTAYIQHNASIPVQALFGITFTLGVIPAVLMWLWARTFTSKWPVNQGPVNTGT